MNPAQSQASYYITIHTCSIPENHLHHRNGRSSGPDASVLAAHHCQGNGHRKTCRGGVLCDWCHLGPHALCGAPVPCGCTTSAHRKRSKLGSKIK